MKIGTVLGALKLSRCAPGYENIPWMQVQLEDQVLVAADLTGVEPGDLVLVAQGPAADGYRMDLRCDGIILGKVEQRNNG